MITVYESKAGKVRHVVLTDEGCALFNALTAGRKGDTRIFLRSDGKPWGASISNARLPRHAPAPGFHPQSVSIFSAIRVWIDTCDARRADGRDRRPTWAFRHANDREALRALAEYLSDP
jgi:hypothetical protein